MTRRTEKVVNLNIKKHPLKPIELKKVIEFIKKLKL